MTDKLVDKKDLVNAWILAYLEFVFRSMHDNGRLFNVCSYALDCTNGNSAKRIRPVLCLETADLLGVELEAVRVFCLALELVHTSTLIHDDLPALDNDDVRRGRPSCHKAFGESAAILSGDALIAMAFSLISSANSSDLAQAWASLLSIAYQQVCVGQAMDLEITARENRHHFMASMPDIKKQKLISCYQNKTAPLFVAALRGALLASSDSFDKELEQHFTDFGNSLGILFQVTDDIVEANDNAREKSVDYVSEFGIVEAGAFASTLKEKCFLIISRIESKTNRKASFLYDLVVSITHRSY